MELVGIADVVNDWRIKIAVERSYPVYASTSQAASQTVCKDCEIDPSTDPIRGRELYRNQSHLLRAVSLSTWLVQNSPHGRGVFVFGNL
jgi:hypothetical protein